MSRKGDCWDNAVAESFFGSLKNELVHPMPHAFITREQARRHVANYIYWFNTERLHSTLNYLSPIGFEREALTYEAAA